MLFESSPLPMLVVDDETLRFLATNDAAVRLYGYERGEFFGMNASQFVERTPGSVFRGVFRHSRKNGEPLDIDAVGHLVGWRGRPARLVVINDITERLRAQGALERVNRELERSHERLRALSRRLLEVQEEERGRLARDLHDDIGQALTALKIQLGSLSGVADESAMQARLEECVETTQQTLERVRQLSLSLRPPQLDEPWPCGRARFAPRTPVRRRLRAAFGARRGHNAAGDLSARARRTGPGRFLSSPA